MPATAVTDVQINLGTRLPDPLSGTGPTYYHGTWQSAPHDYTGTANLSIHINPDLWDTNQASALRHLATTASNSQAGASGGS